jgi:hypothetical protein
MAETGGGVEEKSWNFEHKGDETKADMVASAATVLTQKVKDLFAVDGEVEKRRRDLMAAMEKARGPADFARRRRPIRLHNGDQNRDSPLLPMILILLMVAILGGVVVMVKLHAIQEGQRDHEQRIDQLERN